MILGDFWEEIVVLEGIVKFGEIRNNEDFFKLEFEVKNWHKNIHKNTFSLKNENRSYIRKIGCQLD